MRILVGGGSGEERGEFMPPLPFGECVGALSSGADSFNVAEGTIFRFFVEAVVKLGGPTVGADGAPRPGRRAAFGGGNA